MRPMVLGLTVLVLLVAPACVGMSQEELRTYRALPPADQDAMEACRTFLLSKTCGGGGGAGDSMGALMHRGVCINRVQAEYGQLPDAAARRAFLIESGCPSPTVARYFR